jgi:hypothetical protein
VHLRIIKTQTDHESPVASSCASQAFPKIPF